jgi:TolA-binding protein
LNHARVCGIALILGAVLAGQLYAQAQSDAATRQYAVAVGLQNRKLYDLAGEEWDKFLKQFPDDPRQDKAKHYLGTCYLQAGKPDQAIALLAEVVTKYPKLELLDATYLNLGVAQYQRAQKSGKAEDYARAKEAFATLAQKFPKSEHLPRALFYRGEADHHQGKSAEALASYTELIQKYPEHELAADALYALGVGQETLKQLDGAAASFASFLAKHPRHRFATEVRMRLGEARFEQKKYAEAAKLFGQASGDAEFNLADYALLRQARCSYELGEFADAAEQYWNVPRKFPKTQYYDEAVLAGGKCYYQLGKYARAREGLALVAGRDTPSAAEATHWIARSLIKEKQSDQALAELDKAIVRHRSSPMGPQLLLDRADAIYEIPDRRAESIKLYADFAAVHAADPLAPQAQYMAAFAALGTGQHATARGHCQTFLAKFSKHELAPEVVFIQAESLMALGDHTAANASYRQLADQFPRHASAGQARVRAGLALHLQKKHAEAIMTLQPIAATLSDKALAAEAHYLIGRSYAAQSDFARAVPALRASLAAKPDWAQADETLLALAHCLQQNKQTAEAATELNQFIAKFPKSEHVAEARFRLGEYAYAAGNHDQAIEHYRRVVRDHAASRFAAHALYGIGWSQFGKNDFAACVQTMSDLARQHPQSEVTPRARYVRAMAYHQTGQYEPAVADLQAFTASNPPLDDLLDARYVLGLCQVGLKRHDQAVETFAAVLKVNANYAGADKVTYEMAWALKEAGKDAESLAAFTRLAATYPKSPLAAESLFRVAESHYDAGRFAEASRAYFDAQEKAGNSEIGEKAVHKLGWSFFKLNDSEKAAQTFARQLAAFPQGELAGDAQFMIGECHFQRKAWKEALDVFGKVAAARHPTYHALALYRSGQCAAELKQWPASAAFCKQVLDQFADFPQRPEARYGYGWALQNQEKWTEAIAEYEKVTDETNTETAAKARFMIGECYFAQKNHKEAIKNFLKVAYGYSHPEWVASAHFEAGRCFEVLGDVPQAVQSYKTVVEKHPQSPRAATARERLAALGA